MPMNIPFRNGRLDSSGAPSFRSRTIVIRDDVLALALDGAANAILPASYPSAGAVQTVPLTSIVLDFDQRLVDYDHGRLMSIIRGIQQGVNLPPLSVTAQPGGTYDLQNGYHRFLACAILGFSTIPIDQAAAPAVVAVPVAKWVPRRKVVS